MDAKLGIETDRSMPILTDGHRRLLKVSFHFNLIKPVDYGLFGVDSLRACMDWPNYFRPTAHAELFSVPCLM